MAKPGLISRLRAAFRLADDVSVQDDTGHSGIVLHREPIGSTGSKNFSGYPSEEYLSTLHGRNAADIWDKMRRSDTQVEMILSAVKNPIKGAAWSVDPADDTPEAKLEAEFIEHVLLKDMDQPWTEFLQEALTFLDFGFSVFEKTDKLVLNHPKFGTYNGIRSLGFRSQRTIERWKLDPDTGKLVSVAQYAFGDLQRLVDIPAEFLLVFTLKKEGSNFEGVSALRPCYGPWLRKQVYLKLNAIGIEKNAVPTPIVEIPSGKENSPEFTMMQTALASWISHEQGYLTIPAGWKLTMEGNNFDPAKVEASVDAEDRRMAKAFLANMLELGMGSSGGAYALASELSQFFLAGIVHVADIVTGGINQKIIPDLIKMKFGPKDAYPRIRHAGIDDRAGEELSKVMKNLCDSKAIIPDDLLEDELRRRYRLPKKSDIGQRFGGQIDGGTPEHPAPARASGFQHSERVRLAEKTARSQIKDGKAQVKAVMQDGLRSIAQDLVRQVMSKVRRLPESQQLDAVKNLTLKGAGDYRAALQDCLAAVAARAIEQARKEVPKAKNVRLAGSDSGLRLSEFDGLPPKVKKKVQTQTQLLVDSQTADLEKSVYFQLTHSVDSTDSDALIEKDLENSAEEFIEGASIEAGSGNVTAMIVNSARNAFFFSDDVLEEIESFTFVNGDPVSPICQDLAGTTFAKDDPENDRYMPPLHHNCKSYIVPNLTGGKKSDDVEPLKPSSPDLDQYVTLSECHSCK